MSPPRAANSLLTGGRRRRSASLLNGGGRRSASLLVAALVSLLIGAAPAAADAWPGGSSVSIAAPDVAFGDNLSGLAYQPSGSSAPGVIYAVDNTDATTGKPKLWKLVWDAVSSKWIADTSNSWSSGKTLTYTDGSGVPDSEGITLVPGDPNGIFVSTERNDSGKAKNGGKSAIVRPAVLRYDTSAAGDTLVATRDWNLTSDLPQITDSNSGLEAVAWVPDSLLTAKGFIDSNTGAAYNPASYAGHGSGLFFVGVEQTGEVIGYALNQGDNTWTRVVAIASPFTQGTIMDLSYDSDNQHLWAICDNHCGGQTATLDIAQSGPNQGKFVVTASYDRPSGMANLNNEGWTQAPNAECAAGVKPVFWSDDSNDSDNSIDNTKHALRSGTIACTVPIPAPIPTPTPSATPTPTPTPGAVPTPTPGPGSGQTPAPTPTPGPLGSGGGGGGGSVGGSLDKTAPVVSGALKVTSSSRTSGKVSLSLTLSEVADATITVQVRKSAKSAPKTLLKAFTRKALPAGQQTLALVIPKSSRRGSRKGYDAYATIVARDAAGNTATTVISTKIK